MYRYILTRLFYAFISLVLLSITIFVLIRVTGDPVATTPSGSRAGRRKEAP